MLQPDPRRASDAPGLLKRPAGKHWYRVIGGRSCRFRRSRKTTDVRRSPALRIYLTHV
jgi:hypothetical protein